ncbi:MAG: hypothetical protein ACLFPX_01925 [Candidatus Omnitrophota bacterium]
MDNEYLNRKQFLKRALLMLGGILTARYGRWFEKRPPSKHRALYYRRGDKLAG